MGSMEGWLGVRSLRTLELRVERQSHNTTKLVAWMNSVLHSRSDVEDDKVVRDVLAKIEHASLQEEDIKEGWLPKQMAGGFGPVFSITMKEQRFARRLPSKLQLFHHATSLGGVESLIEWRTMVRHFLIPVTV
jgi:cystathionine beta-lyase